MVGATTRPRLLPSAVCGAERLEPRGGPGRHAVVVSERCSWKRTPERRPQPVLLPGSHRESHPHDRVDQQRGNVGKI